MLHCVVRNLSKDDIDWLQAVANVGFLMAAQHGTTAENIFPDAGSHT